MAPANETPAGSTAERTVAGMPTTLDPLKTCEYPIRLSSRSQDITTGEVELRSVTRRCGTRIESDCPSCSKLYRDDAWQVIRSGLYDHNGKQRLATWVTLTAPGADVFGATHSQRRQKGVIRPCRCGQRHGDGDAVIGTPLDPTTYRYDLAADFNAHAGRLATVTWQKLGRILGRKLKVVRVMEYQSRGLIHVHALVLGVVTDRSLALVVRGGRNVRTGRTIKPATHAGWSWGPQCDAQRVEPGSGRRLGSYMSKVISYAVKSAGEGAGVGGHHAEKMSEAGEASCRCEHASPDCRSGRTYMEVETEAGEVVRRIYQTKPSRRPCRRHRAASRGWGFRGHVLATSRTWGLTFGAVRAKRIAYWMPFGPPKPPSFGPPTTFTEWSVEGRGWGIAGLRLSDVLYGLGGGTPPGGTPPLMTYGSSSHQPPAQLQLFRTV